ncbi:MAG TPA: YtxH domain-containing protein [Pseudolysinimonas sp.]|nr:YtxH protein [Schumannella sp.]HEV7741911.1 YtxH domain-containing protein [Pseudolysinimonas sp.]
MKGKILFVAGIGLGYVLGTRAGREKYEELRTAALKVWNDPRVQKQVDAVEDFVKDKAPDVADFVSDNAKKVVAQVSGKKPASRSSSSSTTTRSGSSTTKPSTAKSS